MNKYPLNFYQKRHQETVYSAKTILSMLLNRLHPIHSAVDIGCGVGTWLSVLQENGVLDIQGFDGKWVDLDLLVIPRDRFKQVDLSKKVRLPKKYDLAISLEVAEHLPSEFAEEFVTMLTELSDFILFSAAIPHQGGDHHINERWQSYWVKLFGDLNYVVFDFIRPNIWTDNKIPFWYKQNIFFFSRQQKAEHVRNAFSDLTEKFPPLNIVHPDLFLEKTDGEMTIKDSLRLFLKSLKNFINKNATADQNV